MKLKIVKSEGLAHNSYYLSSGDEAVVIDPRRDCEIYTQLAAAELRKNQVHSRNPPKRRLRHRLAGTAEHD